MSEAIVIGAAAGPTGQKDAASRALHSNGAATRLSPPEGIITQVVKPADGPHASMQDNKRSFLATGSSEGYSTQGSAGPLFRVGGNSNRNEVHSNSTRKQKRKKQKRGFFSSLLCCVSAAEPEEIGNMAELHAGGGGGGGRAFIPDGQGGVDPSRGDAQGYYGGQGTNGGGGGQGMNGAARLGGQQLTIPTLPPFYGSYLLPESHDTEKHCLVLDLDETLVHSSFKPIDNADFVIPVEIENELHQVYVLKRPGVDAFLRRMGELFECVLFTASLAKYADPVCDLLERELSVFKARLFREGCLCYKGNYVKDLSRLGRDLRRVIIIDNSPASYIFHPDNAIPISSWFDNPNDTELLELMPFLEDMTTVKDVCKVLGADRCS